MANSEVWYIVTFLFLAASYHLEFHTRHSLSYLLIKMAAFQPVGLSSTRFLAFLGVMSSLFGIYCFSEFTSEQSLELA